MASAPRLAPKLTLNLIDGDQYRLRLTLTNLSTGDRLDLTGFHAALQVRKAYGQTPLLTLCTATHPNYTNSTGCSIVLLNQAVPATKGQIDLVFDLKQNSLVPGQFVAEMADGVTRYIGVHDLEMTDGASLTRTYLRGPAVFHQEVTVA
jgi:hypothetical protein